MATLISIVVVFEQFPRRMRSGNMKNLYFFFLLWKQIIFASIRLTKIFDIVQFLISGIKF